jgi:hypothetical protein
MKIQEAYHVLLDFPHLKGCPEVQNTMRHQQESCWNCQGFELAAADASAAIRKSSFAVRQGQLEWPFLEDGDGGSGGKPNGHNRMCRRLFQPYTCIRYVYQCSRRIEWYRHTLERWDDVAQHGVLVVRESSEETDF